MSARLAAVYQPNSKSPPSAIDKLCNNVLNKYIDANYPPESVESRRNRERVLQKVEKLIKDLVRKCTLANGGTLEAAAEAGGNIFISGSYRLGVHTEGTDIDIVCCMPRQVTHEDFFGQFCEDLEARGDTAEVAPIPGAIVPMIGLQIDGIDIDLLYASLPSATVSLTEKDVLNDDILRGVDDSTAKALNGPRVNNMVYKLVPNFEEFKTCLRCLRLWGKRRGLYSNKVGYLWGVNFSILAAFVSQLYPKACASTLMENLFTVMLEWKWPNPIKLCHSYEPGLNMEQWDPTISTRAARDLMPIITPAYPVMNSSYSTNNASKKVMLEEFKRAKGCMSRAQERIVMASVSKGDQRKKPEDLVEEFGELFEPYDFFCQFGHFIVVDITANTEAELVLWEQFVESRLRQIVLQFERRRLPFSTVRVHPKITPGQRVSEGNEGKHGSCGWIGLLADEDRAKGQVDIRETIEFFKHGAKGFEHMGVMNWDKRGEGMSVDVELLSFDSLPEFVFPEDTGGRADAKKRRKKVRKALKEERRAKQEKKDAEKAAYVARTQWNAKDHQTESQPAAADEVKKEAKAEAAEDDSGNVEGGKAEVSVPANEEAMVKTEAGDMPSENVPSEETVEDKAKALEDKKLSEENKLLVEKDRLLAEEMKKTVNLSSMLSKGSKKRKAKGGKKNRKKMPRMEF